MAAELLINPSAHMLVANKRFITLNAAGLNGRADAQSWGFGKLVQEGLQQRRMSHVPAIRVDPPLISSENRPLYDIYIKGSPEKGEVGDCPFSHRMMLTMEEKGVSFNKLLLDEQNMPDWISEVCEGNKQIPFMLELDTGKWLHDSDKMVPYLESKYPDPQLGMPEDGPDVGRNLMPTCLIEYLTSKPGEDEVRALRQLEAELRAIDEYLGTHNDGPFFGGQTVNSHDIMLAPKLKHTIIASKEIKGWDLPGSYGAIYTFMDAMSERPSWKATYYSDKYVQDGWQLKIKQLTEK